MNSYEKKYEVQKNLVEKQLAEIDRLKNKIAELERTIVNKDKHIKDVEGLNHELSGIADELREKRDKYDELINELREMKNVINHKVFKGRWKLIKWLVKY